LDAVCRLSSWTNDSFGRLAFRSSATSVG
jgi:hypothetical protein